MKKILKQLILQYTGIKIENNNQNLLDLPIYEELWLCIIIDAENNYHLPILNAIEDIKPDEFTLDGLDQKIHIYNNMSSRNSE